MAKDFPKLDDKHRAFISRQKIFFTATAAQNAQINISPRSTNYFRIIDENQVLYLDRTGSGNETAAHIGADGRMTIMFCAFDGPPQILRLYGQGEIVHRNQDAFAALVGQYFNNDLPLGTRQMVRLKFYLVKTSCGFGVPLFDYRDERASMDNWAQNKGPEGIQDYWREKNQFSMDGLPTGIFDFPDADDEDHKRNAGEID